MLVYLLLFVTLLLAVLSLYLTGRGLQRGLHYGWPMLLCGLALGTFIYLYGTWVYLSVYLRYVFVVMAIPVIMFALLRHRTHKPGPVRVVLNLVCCLLFGALSVLYFTGTGGRPQSITIPFPLKAGRYIILQGGKGLPANLFHAGGQRKAAYAIDIARLNRWGNRASSIFSTRLEDYEIFNDTIYSPCDCIVRRAVSDNPDNIPPRRVRGPHNLNGTLLEAPAFYLYLGHMKQYQVFVQEGQQLRVGQPIGLVGNSGMSIEPHLHIQAHAKADPDEPWYRQPQLFIRFNRKTYLLFDVIDTDDLPMSR